MIELYWKFNAQIMAKCGTCDTMCPILENSSLIHNSFGEYHHSQCVLLFEHPAVVWIYSTNTSWCKNFAKMAMVYFTSTCNAVNKC